MAQGALFAETTEETTASFIPLYEQGHYGVSIHSDSDTCPLITAAYPCS